MARVGWGGAAFVRCGPAGVSAVFVIRCRPEIP
nr:MAG TPA: hypothetical protein [Caudoviricetes sp.]